MTLAAIGRETTRIRLGTLVTPVTFRFPGPLAIQVAQADAMSGGRVELGLGAGWYDGEHTSYAIPFPPTGDRFDDARRAARDRDRPVGRRRPARRSRSTGKHHQVVDSPALPKPVQRPRPPIIIGGWGTKRTPRLAARFADEFNMPFAPVSYFREGCDHVRAACETIGRDPATMRFTVALVVVRRRRTTPSSRGARARAAKIPSKPRANAAAGTPAEVVDRIREFEQAGAETVYLQYHTLDEPEHLQLIGEPKCCPHVGSAA